MLAPSLLQSNQGIFTQHHQELNTIAASANSLYIAHQALEKVITLLFDEEMNNAFIKFTCSS